MGQQSNTAQSLFYLITHKQRPPDLQSKDIIAGQRAFVDTFLWNFSENVDLRGSAGRHRILLLRETRIGRFLPLFEVERIHNRQNPQRITPVYGRFLRGIIALLFFSDGTISCR